MGETQIASFAVPSTDLILLTDEKWSASVFATPASQFGLMLSRGATRFLYHTLFSSHALTIDRTVTELRLEPDLGARFNADVIPWLEKHPGLTISDAPPALTPVNQQEVAVSAQSSLRAPGLKSVDVGPGRVLSRHIAGFLVQYHIRAQPLPEGTVPIIEAPQSVGIHLEPEVPSALPQFLPKRTTAVAGVRCAACAGCAICAGCAFCGQANFAVGAVGLGGLVGLIGLATTQTM
jgi:hypothetical protein